MIKRILGFYYGISFLLDLFFSFIFATYVLFLMARGMDLFQVNIINIFFMATVLLFEIPTGVAADILGRKPSLIISCLLMGLGFLVYFFSGNFWWFILAEIIIGIGITFHSGAFQAWLVDSLSWHGFQGSWDKIFSREQQISNAGRIIGALAGAYIARIDLSLPWFFGAIGIFATAILAKILMKENYFEKRNFKIREIFKGMKKTGTDGICFGLKNKSIIFVMALGAIQACSVQGANMFWQPLFGRFFVDVSFFGWIFLIMNLVIIGGNQLAGFLLRSTKNEKLSLLVPQFIIGGGLIFSSLFVNFVPIFIFYLLHEFGRGIFLPIKSGCLNKNIPSEKRATVLSFDSMILKLGNGAGLLISGILVQRFSILAVWLVSGIFLIFSSIIVYLVFIKKIK